MILKNLGIKCDIANEDIREIYRREGRDRERERERERESWRIK